MKGFEHFVEYDEAQSGATYESSSLLRLVFFSGGNPKALPPGTHHAGLGFPLNIFQRKAVERVAKVKMAPAILTFRPNEHFHTAGKSRIPMLATFSMRLAVEGSDASIERVALGAAAELQLVEDDVVKTLRSLLLKHPYDQITDAIPDLNSAMNQELGRISAPEFCFLVKQFSLKAIEAANSSIREAGVAAEIHGMRIASLDADAEIKVKEASINAVVAALNSASADLEDERKLKKRLAVLDGLFKHFNVPNSLVPVGMWIENPELAGKLALEAFKIEMREKEAARHSDLVSKHLDNEFAAAKAVNSVYKEVINPPQKIEIGRRDNN